MLIITSTAVKTGDATYKFSGTQTTLSHSVTQGTVTASGSYTPAGSVSSSFSGTWARLKGTFTGKSITSSGTLPTATFAGTKVAISFSGTSASHSHSIPAATITASGSFTPSGSVSSSFSGT